MEASERRLAEASAERLRRHWDSLTPEKKREWEEATLHILCTASETTLFYVAALVAWDYDYTKLCVEGKEILGTGAEGKECHDCGRTLRCHEWVEVRCTLDNEDTTMSYCSPCYLERTIRYAKIRGRLQ